MADLFRTANTSMETLLPQLRPRRQWVCWRTERRDGDPSKVPLDPSTCTCASVTDADTWAGFELARAVADARVDVDGVGFVFTAEDPFVGIDLDDCLTLATPGPGVRPTARARSVVDRVDSYTELSPSHTGLHVLAQGDLPIDGTKADGLELYTRRRFFTVTGDHVQGTPTKARDRRDALETVFDAYLETEVDKPTPTAAESGASAPGTADSLADDAALDAIVERARNAANGDRFERLWHGSTAGYPSHSEADMALCTFLAFWTGGDADTMDTLFRRSGLMRPKWDAKRGDSTYGERTIARALAYVDDYYEPERRSDET